MARRLDKIVVVDVEATCWDGRPPNGQFNDIIEIGITLMDVRSLDIDKPESIIVKPTNSQISSFCTELTTLTQQQVDQGIAFSAACKKLEKDYDTRNRVWASWGDYDRVQFGKQCDRERIYYPFGRSHINVKNLFALKNAFRKAGSVMRAMDFLDFQFEGTLHRGVDDAWNIARILRHIFEGWEE